MLATGAHVKIGTYEYLLDESQENHYVHRFEPLFVPKIDITGQPGKQQVRPEKLLWSMDDWGGGEGNAIYYPDDPLVYDYSFGLNGRIRGQLTGRPARVAKVADLTTNDNELRPILSVADAALWYAGGYRIGYTTDTSTWTVVDSTGVDATDFTQLQSKSTSFRITAATGDQEYFIYSAWHSGGAGAGTRILLGKEQNNSAAAGDIESSATSKSPHAGLAPHNGRLYGWTGKKLIEYDLFDWDGSTELTSDQKRTVYNTGVDTANTHVLGNTWWANCIATENSVVFFYSVDAQSQVYEYKHGVGRPLWKPPLGYTIKSLTYQNGVVFFGGHWGGDSNATGRGAIYALPLHTRRPVFLGWVRRQNDLNLQIQEMCASYGSQIMFAAAKTGRIFIYDMDMDAISMLDDIQTAGTGTEDGVAPPRIPNTDATSFTGPSTEKIGDMITFGTKRVVIYYTTGGSGTTYSTVVYDDDQENNRQASTSTADYSAPLVSGTWDFDFPMENKALMGFHVAYLNEDDTTTSGLKAGQEIKIEYALDNGTWTTAATLTSATSPSGGIKGRHFVSVSSGSSTKKFYQMRIRVTLYGKRVSAVNYQAPILYALTTEAHLLAYAETWELILRVKDEQDEIAPDHRRYYGHELRDFIEDLAQTKDLVTFLDGYRYRAPGSYTTNVVSVEDPIDIIDRNSEGSLRVKLRAVSV